MISRNLWFLPLICVVGACSSSPERTYQRDPLDRYDHYAGPSIDSFAYRGSLDGWRVVDSDRVVVWTTHDDAYLLTAERDCTDFAKASNLKLSSSHDSVSRGYDYIIARDKRCRITDIHHVDYATMRRDAGEPRRDDDHRRDD
jgi:hypothetical protein